MESDLSCEICPNCGTKQIMVLEILGRSRKVHVRCQCKSEIYEQERKDERQKQQQHRLERLRSYSLMDEKFRHCTFENWNRTKENEKLYRLGKKYCDEWSRLKSENVGLLLWGPPGTGKTYLSSCIANTLLEELIPVIAISSIGILNRIKSTYGSYGQEGEVEIINSMKNAALLVLDDLGAENNTEWSQEKLYEMIDSRYRLEKPMIVTTNLSLQQLKNKLTGRDGVSRTYDRLMEMCIPVEVQDTSKRAEAGRGKTMLLRSLLQE
ncbi:AAA ATPase [Alkaliphilus metalliredigens QYMF]|uniref:AAA ATPase n=2 Tax=Alkaliphilus TaxID=114627 RepID=A6TQ10_ALKMQ|nr:AAA ATPase [Alkaliphilus metalliredigens QYMF]